MTHMINQLSSKWRNLSPFALTLTQLSHTFTLDLSSAGGKVRHGNR